MLFKNDNKNYSYDYNAYVRNPWRQCRTCGNWSSRVYYLMAKNDSIDVIFGCEECGTNQTVSTPLKTIKSDLKKQNKDINTMTFLKILRLGFQYRSLFTSDEQYQKFKEILKEQHEQFIKI